MRVIAITGGIGSGKTTVAGWIRKTGVPVVDADRISRALTAQDGQALPLIRQAFGDGVFHPDGTLDRAALAALVFTEDPAPRKTLERILHPMVIARMQGELAALKAQGTPIAVTEVPLLYEAGAQGMADAVLCVTAREETRLNRLMARSGLTRAQALARMHAQHDVDTTEALADYVLSTDASTQENKQNTLRLWQQIISEHKE